MEHKRRRVLTNVVGMGGISDRSLANVLNFVKDNPEAIEQEVKQRELSDVAMQNLRQAGECTHSFALKDGTPFEWPFLSLRRVIPWLCDRGPAFATILEETISRHGNLLGLVLYTDEFAPGQVLKIDNQRKSAVWHVSLRQFGPLLCHCDLWIAIAVLRSKFMLQIPDGLSAPTRVLLRDWFLGPQPLQTVGVAVRLKENAGPILVHFRLGAIIADEDALIRLWCSKSAAGTLPCFFCPVLAKDCQLKQRDPSLHDITSSEYAAIPKYTDEDKWKKTDTLIEAKSRMTATKFAEMEQGFGLKWAPQGILSDVQLRPFVRPVKFSRHDPMHVLYSNDIVGIDIWQYLLALKRECGRFLTDLREYASNPKWHACQSQPVNIVEVLAPIKEKMDRDALKGQASDFILLYPFVRFYAETEAPKAGAMEAPYDSLMVLCEILDLFKKAQEARDEEALKRIAKDMDFSFNPCLFKG